MICLCCEKFEDHWSTIDLCKPGYEWSGWHRAVLCAPQPLPESCSDDHTNEKYVILSPNHRTKMQTLCPRPFLPVNRLSKSVHERWNPTKCIIFDSSPREIIAWLAPPPTGRFKNHICKVPSVIFALKTIRNVAKWTLNVFSTLKNHQKASKSIIFDRKSWKNHEKMWFLKRPPPPTALDAFAQRNRASSITSWRFVYRFHFWNHSVFLVALTAQKWVGLSIGFDNCFTSSEPYFAFLSSLKEKACSK